MIVTTRGSELWLTRQYDHSCQAGELARWWGEGSSDRPKLDESVSLGVEKHDVGWIEPDNEVLYDPEAGRPVSFTQIDLRKHLQFYRDGYERALALNPYSGLMVGMHWIGLYTRRFGYDPTFAYQIPDELVPIFDEAVTGQEKEWVDIKRSLWSVEERRSDFENRIWMNYELVQFMDRLSLFLHMTDLNERAEATLGPVRFREDAPMNELSIRYSGNGDLEVDPFPFGEEFTTAIIVRRINNRSYESHESLCEALREAEDEVIEFSVRSAGRSRNSRLEKEENRA